MATKVADLYAVLGLRRDSSWREGAHVIRDLKTALYGLATFSGLKAISGLVTETGKFAVHTKALGQQMGLTTDSVQLWGYVAEQAGSNVDEMSIGLIRLSKNLKMLADGRDTQGARALTEYGISAQEAAQALKSPDGINPIMMKIAANMQKVGVSGQTAQRSYITFGRASKSIVSDLIRGPAELNKLFDAVKRRGAIIPAKDIEEAAHMGNNIANLKQELHAFARMAVGSLAPALNKMLMEATEWVAAHRELLKEVLGKAVMGLAWAFGMLAKGIQIAAHFIEDLKAGMPYAIALVEAFVATLVVFIATSKLAWVQSAAKFSYMLAMIYVAIRVFNYLKERIGVIPAGIIAIGSAIALSFGGGPMGWITAFIKKMWQLVAAQRASAAIGMYSPKQQLPGGGGAGGGAAVGALGAISSVAAPIAIAYGLSELTGGSFGDIIGAKGGDFSDIFKEGGIDRLRKTMNGGEGGNGPVNVTGGNTTININGVPDAVGAIKQIDAAVAEINERELRKAIIAAGGINR